MRRLGLVMLVASLVLGACGKKEESESQSMAEGSRVSQSLSSKAKKTSTAQEKAASAEENQTENDQNAGQETLNQDTSSSSQASKSEAVGEQASASSEKAPAKSSERQKTKDNESSKASKQSSSAMAQNLPPNGYYHTVQGKYGEVLIVNKKHPLAPNYGPGEDPTALAAFWQLVGDMRAQGFSVSDAYSGFRSYDYQAQLYQNYVNRDGQAAADRYSARPGYSEHQTGLAFDLIDGNGALLEEPAASRWLAKHAHHYGFVVRYLPGKEHITGYMAESWHIRYIGPEAEDIYRSGLTLEEYYGIEGGGY